MRRCSHRSWQVRIQFTDKDKRTAAASDSGLLGIESVTENHEEEVKEEVIYKWEDLEEFSLEKNIHSLCIGLFECI